MEVSSVHMPLSNAIFISYRRSDSSDATGRISDRLLAHFGREVVFKDVHSIPYGVDFRIHIRQAVAQCQVLIAVIGPTWLTVTDAQGDRRLDHPDDWVRLEVETALARNIPVIPLLVGNAKLPRAADLPEGLQDLAHKNAAQARPDPDFDVDLSRLIRRLEDIVGVPGASVGRSTPAPSVSLASNPPVPLLEISSADSLMLKSLKEQHNSLAAQMNAVSEALLFADSARLVQLEQQRDSLFRKMQQVEEKLRRLEDVNS